MDLRHSINEGLMTFFFLVSGSRPSAIAAVRAARTRAAAGRLRERVPA
jgi:hypothetical protein